MNKVILMGRLGQNPEMRYFPTGGAVTKFSLATSKRWKDQSGQRQESTEWHRCVIYGNLAQWCYENLKKGQRVFITAEIHYSRFINKKTGDNQYSTEIVVKQLQFVDPQQNTRSTTTNHPYHDETSHSSW